MSRMDRKKLQCGYDTVAQEYVTRIFRELDDKPLDRQLLDDFSSRVRGAVWCVTSDAALAMLRGI